MYKLFNCIQLIWLNSVGCTHAPKKVRGCLEFQSYIFCWLEIKIYYCHVFSSSFFDDWCIFFVNIIKSELGTFIHWSFSTVHRSTVTSTLHPSLTQMHHFFIYLFIYWVAIRSRCKIETTTPQLEWHHIFI